MSQTHTTQPAGFGSDVDLTHPWVAQHRIPLLADTTEPTGHYLIAVTVPEAGDPPRFRSWRALWPTEVEAAVIGSAINFARSEHYNSKQQQMLTRPLDVGGSRATLVLVKQDAFTLDSSNFTNPGGWTYCSAHWTEGYHLAAKPQWTADLHGLLAMLDDIWKYDRMWEPWKAAHPEVFDVVPA